MNSFISKTIENSKNVYEIIKKLQQETNELGLFARKWMNRTFANRCGMKIEKCVDVITELNIEIQKLSNYVQNQKIDNSLPILKKLSWFIQVLENLTNHFHECKDDAKGWIKDPNELKVALDTLDVREQSILNFISKLSEIESLI